VDATAHIFDPPIELEEIKSRPGPPEATCVQRRAAPQEGQKPSGTNTRN